MHQDGLVRNFQRSIKSLINSFRGPPLMVVAFLYSGILKIKTISSAQMKCDTKNLMGIGMLTCVLMNHPKCVHAWNGVMLSISVNCAVKANFWKKNLMWTRKSKQPKTHPPKRM